MQLAWHSPLRKPTWPFSSIYFAPFIPSGTRSKSLQRARARQARGCPSPCVLSRNRQTEEVFVPTVHPSQTVAEGPCSRLALELCSLVWPGAGPSLAKPASGEAEAAGLLPIMLGSGQTQERDPKKAPASG